MTDIKYKRNVSFEGRNGFFKQSGISVSGMDDYINLFPITSRGYIGRCMLEIPKESIPAVIKALRAELDKRNKCAKVLA